MDGIQPILSYTIWLQLPQAVRSDIARIFKLRRTGEAVVHVGAIINDNISGEIASDGYTAEDLQDITVEKMQEFTGIRSTDFYKLFTSTLEVLNGETPTLPEQLGHGLEVEKPKNKGGRPRKTHVQENKTST